MSILRRDSEVRRDVVEVSFEKLSSPSSSDAERGSSNEVFGGYVTCPNEELVDAWQSKSLRENENTVFETVSKYFKSIAFGIFLLDTLRSRLTSRKCMNSDFRSNQHVEKVIFIHETVNVQCDLRFEGEKQVKTSSQIFKNMLAENYHQRDRRDAPRSRMLEECENSLYCHSDLEIDTGGHSNIKTFKDISGPDDRKMGLPSDLYDPTAQD